MKETPKKCLTLRLEPQIDEMVVEAAHARRTTKSEWIRSAIRQRLKSYQMNVAEGDRTCR